MKKLAILFFFFSLSSILSVYSQKTKGIITFDFMWGDKGDLAIYATNNDCCEYYISFHLPNPRGLTPIGGNKVQRVIGGARTQIMSLKRIPNQEANTGRYSYSFHAGNPNLKPNLDYQYALPIAAGDSLRVSPAQSELYTQQFHVKNTNDTIYASRAGVVCDYLLRETQTITIYHKDGTLADYKPPYRFAEILVQPGKKVSVGQPIAIADPIQKGVLFSVYFLEKKKLKEKMNPHSGLVPLFQIKGEENVKLGFHKSYVAELTADMITQDMTKKERAKYMKNISKTEK